MNYYKYVDILKYISQENSSTLFSLAELLGITQKDLFLYVQELRSYGCPLGINKDKTITLLRSLDAYNHDQILYEISSELNIKDIELAIFLSLSSSNTHLKSLPCKESKIQACLVEHQTEGRGRRGKSWVSPFGANIYLSIRKKIQVSPKESGCASLIVGLAVISALESMGYYGMEIKWPNDIYFQGKKLAGVLIEAVSVKVNSVELVVGIGLNINMSQDASKHIDQPWIDLYQMSSKKPPSRNEVAVALITNINSNLALFEVAGLAAFLNDWTQYDYLNGKTITVKQEQVEVYGKAMGINEQGELLVSSDNEILAVNAGEVSVRLLLSSNCE
ncbi:MAG: biotin--[acetyl-CoA-carboxylase] ligase [Gammaproteobacteria bacterium]|nr:biotin--[acetyl-CoA-carboxylase] ligase [Gammaproteobacteria bacterium]